MSYSEKITRGAFRNLLLYGRSSSISLALVKLSPEPFFWFHSMAIILIFFGVDSASLTDKEIIATKKICQCLIVTAGKISSINNMNMSPTVEEIVSNSDCEYEPYYIYIYLT
jgi:hypothetical protein